MYCWPQELVDKRGHSHLGSCFGATELTTKEQAEEAFGNFAVLFYDRDNEQVPGTKAWEFVGPSICF